MSFALGARQLTQFKNWVPTAACFGVAAAMTGCYITDWQVVCRYIPFYNQKFPAIEPSEDSK